jgi:stage II sporulation protein E
MPEIAVTALLVWPLAGRIPLQGHGTAAREAKHSAGAVVCETLVLPPAASERLAEALRELSGILYRDAKRERGREAAQMTALAERVLGQACEECPERERCRGKTEELPRPLRGAVSALCRTGEMTEESLSDLRKGCALAPKMEERLRILEWSLANRRRGQREVSAGNFDAVARLLGESAAKVHAEWREDLQLESALRDALREIGVAVGRVTVRGDRVRRIDAGGLRWDGQDLPAERIQAELERVCGCSLSAPGYEMEDGFVTLHMHTVRRYSARVAVASAPSAGETVSGDRTAHFETGEDYFYGLLCDGMGTGDEAAGTAELCIGILSGMLRTGNNQDTSLKLLNSLLRGGAGECSTTVDLLEVDLLYGKASFVKSGAAASYVKRGEHLFRIRSDTAPMGILRALDAERICFSVRPGDEIVLLSDGVSQSMEDAPWLPEYLATAKEKSTEETAREILELARSHGSGDDMTVMLVQIEPYRPEIREEERITA